MRRLIAIDPGASGGIAWRGDDGVVRAEAMPDSMTGQIDFLRGLALDPAAGVVLERVGTYVPGNSGPAAATFARHVGHLEAAMYTLGLPIVWNPTPVQWQKWVGTLPKDKADRKRAIREWAARRYPHLRVTLRTADALAMLAWAEAKGAGE